MTDELPTLQILHHLPSNARLRLTHPNGEIENIVVHRDGRIERWFGDKPDEDVQKPA